MEYTEILEAARATAKQLGIRIKNPALITRNMEPGIGVVTILHNGDYTLWIDKHYIAYTDNFEPEIVYVFADAEHIGEELRSVSKRMPGEQSPYFRKTLESVRRQLELADAAMRETGGRHYVFEDRGNGKTRSLVAD